MSSVLLGLIATAIVQLVQTEPCWRINSDNFTNNFRNYSLLNFTITTCRDTLLYIYNINAGFPIDFW